MRKSPNLKTNVLLFQTSSLPVFQTCVKFCDLVLQSGSLKLQDEVRSLIHPGLNVNGSFVRLNDIECGSQTQAQAVSFKSKIRFE